MEALAALTPAIAKVDILVDMRLVEIDQVMTIPLCLGQQRTELRNKGLPALGIRPRSGLMPCQAVSRLGTPQQLPGLLPRQLKAVQGGADRLAAVEAGEALLHQSDQAAKRPAWLRISPGYGWAGRFLAGRTDCFAERGLDVWAKGGRPPLR